MTIPVLLLLGMMCDERLFAAQVSAIDDRAVLMPALDSAETMTALASDVIRHAPDQFILGGLSMGGIAAMEVLRLAPERIAGLILMDTNPLAEAESVKHNRARQIVAVKAGDLRRVMGEEMIPKYVHRDNDRADIDNLCLDMAENLGAEVFVRQSCALRDRFDQTVTLRGFRKPCLIMHGEDDQLCPKSRHTLMYDLMPQAHYHIIADAGHLPPLETPEAVNKRLLAWIQEHFQ